mgnify:CR=1 FL=1
MLEVSSIVIAICALGLTIWQGWMTREHNRLSVQPAICSWAHQDENNAHYWIQNKGHGTAKISSFDFYVKGKKATTEELRQVIRQRIKNYGDNEIHIGIFESNSYFEKGEKVDLIKITTTNNETKPVPFEAILDDCQLIVKYRSLYGGKELVFNSEDYS